MTTETPSISLVIPVRNEVGNVGPVLAEIETALASLTPYEVIIVDDGSSDGTGEAVARLQMGRPFLRQVRHLTSCGKAAAVRSGVKLARAPVIVTMDGDGQNDPSAIPKLVATLAEAGPGCGLVAAQRLRREDTDFKRFQSRMANAIRAAILKDETRDTNCGLKCFPRHVYLDLPFFDGIHRFLPALVRRDGLTVALIDVVDRPRLTGVSNYGFWDRLWVGLWDLIGVHWIIARRARVPVASEVDRDAG